MSPICFVEKETPPSFEIQLGVDKENIRLIMKIKDLTGEVDSVIFAFSKDAAKEFLGQVGSYYGQLKRLG